MGFYEDRLMPIIKKTVAVLEKTEHMQDILNGTMSEERFRFQIKHNYNYLMEFTRCWGIGFAKCNGFEELNTWYRLLVDTMENEVILNRDFWAKKIGLSLEEMDKTVMAAGKRSYTSYELARSGRGPCPAGDGFVPLHHPLLFPRRRSFAPVQAPRRQYV
jgi:thiaminase/transcriptional activator TenA